MPMPMFRVRKLGTEEHTREIEVDTLAVSSDVKVAWISTTEAGVIIVTCWEQPDVIIGDPLQLRHGTYRDACITKASATAGVGA